MPSWSLETLPWTSWSRPAPNAVAYLSRYVDALSTASALVRAPVDGIRSLPSAERTKLTLPVAGSVEMRTWPSASVRICCTRESSAAGCADGGGLQRRYRRETRAQQRQAESLLEGFHL